MLQKARKEGYAIPAFNAENMEMVQGIIAAAVKCNSPVIIQTTMPTVKYISPELMTAMVKAEAGKTPLSIALHLDHCDDISSIKTAIDAGYTSVMFDGSKLPLSENIDLTKKVINMAGPLGITVEAELGTIGGKEDNVSSQIQYTKTEDAVFFSDKTSVDILAVAIGTAHGFYKGEPILDFERLREISDKIGIPLVLHGGSGVPDEKIKKAISLGISKVNFATELRAAATFGVREILADKDIIDPKKYMGKARENVTNLCTKKIKLCGSYGKGEIK